MLRRLSIFVYGLVCYVVFFATFLINHFDLFGLRQIWLQLLGRPYHPLAFGTPGPYRPVRHPLYLGWLLAFWATPTMSVTHLVFALATASTRSATTTGATASACR
jgi:protein-S-isoprenylcysteine O-methyltransferase Ste14